MSQGSSVINIDIGLSDMDRGVYETVELKLAQHASESEAFLVTRAIAYALELCEGLSFSQGLSSSDDPAIWVHDLTGQLMAWIDIGLPSPSRVHKASKAAERVAIYMHRDPSAWLGSLAKEKVYAPERVALYALDPRAIDAIAAGLQRRNTWSLSRMEGVLYLEANGESFELVLETVEWPR
jgi:uncharacterized protein YaeQ